MHDIGAVVDFIRNLRGVESVSLVAWSLGGPRAGEFAARNPELVDRLVLLAPAYNRASASERPASLTGGALMNIQSRADFDANWNRQVGCMDQYDPAVADVVWREMLRSDAVGATWGPGVRRAPRTPTWGWNAEVVGRTTIPTLLISPEHDRQVPPSRVFDLYDDLGRRTRSSSISAAPPTTRTGSGTIG